MLTKISQFYALQATFIFDVVKILIVRREETAKSIIAFAFRQLHRILCFQIQQVIVAVAVKLTGKQQFIAITGKAFLIEIIAMTQHIGRR
ncbi:hypothetical protein SRABI106_04700 [Rahnella aquatilis]|nr:hypothetical protein SRABI106_04700 [Rahnella aquatilis]